MRNFGAYHLQRVFSTGTAFYSWLRKFGFIFLGDLIIFDKQQAANLKMPFLRFGFYSTTNLNLGPPADSRRKPKF